MLGHGQPILSETEFITLRYESIPASFKTYFPGPLNIPLEARSGFGQNFAHLGPKPRSSSDKIEGSDAAHLGPRFGQDPSVQATFEVCAHVVASPSVCGVLA